MAQIIHGLQCRQLLGCRSHSELIHGIVGLRREFFDRTVERIGDTDGEGGHGLINDKLLSGVMAWTPIEYGPRKSVPPSFESFDVLGQANEWSMWIRNPLELHGRPVFLQPLGRSGFLHVFFKASQLGLQPVQRDLLPLARGRFHGPATQRIAQTLDRLDRVFSQCWDQPHVSTRLGIL